MDAQNAETREAGWTTERWAEYLTPIDLCAILGHDPYEDEPSHCGRCDARFDGSGSADD